MDKYFGFFENAIYTLSEINTRFCKIYVLSIKVYADTGLKYISIFRNTPRCQWIFQFRHHTPSSV